MIKLKDVSFHYGGETGTGEGIDDINLTIAAGEFIVLCGRSGCGKTTLTRTINGLAPHFYEGYMEGLVHIDEYCVTTGELSDVSAYVGSIFQNPKSQFFNIDTTSELVFGCENLNLKREEIDVRLNKTVEDFLLDALVERNIFELSGGEKQQIACGSVYAAEPPVFVMDEPSSNLDKKAIHRLREALERIKASGKTVVVSEHRLYYLMDLADRFIYMNDGRIEHIFSAAEIKAMDDAELSRLGLRAADMSTIEPNRSFQAQTSSSSQAANSAHEHAVQAAGRESTPKSFAKKVAIEGIDLSCNRGNTQILDIENLQLPKGSVVALIGDNGSGKSTLAESLCGVNRVNGSVAFNGTFMSDKQRAEESFMVMQDVNHQLFSASVIEEVMMNAPVSRDEAVAILDELNLAGCEERHPASLSGGQKQRVAIASALCAGKKVIFYDEPTSGLDREGMERFGSMLNRVSGRADISVIVTHDLELVMHCCTHILHIEDGRVSGVYPLDDEGVKRVRYYFLSASSHSTSKKRSHQGPFSKILQYTGKYRKLTYASVAIMIAAVAASLAPYLVIYALVSTLISGGSVTFEQGALAVGVVLGCEIIYAILYILGLSLSHIAAYKTLENIRCSLQEKLEVQPIGTIKDMGTGSVKKTFSDDIESLETLLAHLIPEGIANIAVPAIALLVMIAVDWQMALLTAVMIYFGYLAMRQMYSTGIERMGSYFASTKRLNNTIIEYVNGMEVVKVFNRDGQSSAKLRNMIVDYRDYALAWYKACWPWMATYSSIFPTVVLYSLPLGALLVVLGHLTLPAYVLALCLSFGMAPMLIHCIGFMSTVPQINYKIQSLEKTMDRPALKATDAPFSGSNHSVSLERVRFAYGDDEVLRDVSFTAEEGSLCAIVGESGSGKSTIGRLIVHHYDVATGSVTIGGQDIRDMSLDALGNQVSYVSQELFLFNMSILENIRIGRADATDEEVMAAAQKAQCVEFIEALPKGYHTSAGDAGNKLSGGERQRIAFARAILKDAPVIVLDEATAFIDPENEQRMTRAIREVIKSKTVIVIAHRLRTIAGADQIVVMEKGKVAAKGTHNQLLETCERYQKLWNASESSTGWAIRSAVPQEENQVAYV